MIDAPERIWAEDRTLMGDPCRNGSWEDRQPPILVVAKWHEYVRADIHRELALELLSASGESQEAYERQQELDSKVSRLSKDAVEYNEYAARLATVIAKRYYPENKEWEVGDNFPMIIDQIDNSVAGLGNKVSRMRGIIAEMAMYDWNGIATSPNAPPDSLRKDVTEAIGFPVQPGEPSAGK